MSIIATAGPDEPGANYTPPTLGSFMEKQKVEIRRLREARAGLQVIKEAKEFHEKRALHYGVHSPRGLAHYRASRMYTREGSRLQEMFENGGEIGELPPKAIIKANKAAMMFHKKQSEKAGLDSDLGHAHIAAMEHHADIMNKAKKTQAQSQQPEVGSGPMDSGGKGRPMKAGGLKKKREALPGYGGKQSPVPVPKKSEQPNEDIHDPTKPPVNLHPNDANKPSRQLRQGTEWGDKYSPSKGWGSPMKMSKEGGPGSGPKGGKHGSKASIRKHSVSSKRHDKAENEHYEKMKEEEQFGHDRAAHLHDVASGLHAEASEAHENAARGGSEAKAEAASWKAWNASTHADNASDDAESKDWDKKESKHESRRRAIDNFGRESNTHDHVNDGLDDTFPKGAGRQVDPYLVHRDPRTKETKSRRSLRRPIWETDDSERDRSASGLTA